MLWKNKKRHRLKAVGAQSLKPVKLLATSKRTRRLPTLLAQQCWEILRPFARSLSPAVTSTVFFIWQRGDRPSRPRVARVSLT